MVPVYAGFTPKETREALQRKMEPSYQGTFTSAKRHVLHTFANTHSPLMKKRVAQYMLSERLPALSRQTAAGGIAFGQVCRFRYRRYFPAPAETAGCHLASLRRREQPSMANRSQHPEKVIVTQRISADIVGRLAVLLDLGLGYLTLERSTPTLSPGELQRLRLATQVHSNLFGVVYVLDEPSAGLHPADTEALLAAFERLRAAGNSLFVVEHDLDVIRHADWIVDVGPGAGEHGGRVLYSGPPAGLEQIEASVTRRYLFGDPRLPSRKPRSPQGWLRAGRRHAQ